MLALTHHILVAIAAQRCGFPIGTFRSYAVLGDDIVIANGPTAQKYLQLMAEIGVEIGLAKSLVSKNGTFEFAKRFFHKGIDCSPISIREILSSTFTLAGSIDLAKKYGLTFPKLLSILGRGFRAKAALTGPFYAQAKRIRHLGSMYFSPHGAVPLPLDL